RAGSGAGEVCLSATVSPAIGSSYCVSGTAVSYASDARISPLGERCCGIPNQGGIGSSATPIRLGRFLAVNLCVRLRARHRTPAPMTVLSVQHVTTYRYKQPVSFGQHRIMFRPRDSYDQKLIEATLTITPEPRFVRWLHDPFGNCVAIA